ncbi:MAG: hypothetical protein ACJ8R9_14675 [Steroidobacteraceae bacterium]
MATIEYWIQLENRPWDMSPHNIDRMTGRTMQQITTKAPATVTLNSVVPGTSPRMVTMFNPIRDDAGDVTDALILRRYRPPVAADQSDAWTVPDDRKVNPWDLNEHNPGESGTMGTIPGPVIECNVGDGVVVHFKNGDGRVGQSVLTRTHSLHPHGFVFQATSDGAYPLTPPDSSQPTGPEAPLWASIGVTGQFKQGRTVTRQRLSRAARKSRRCPSSRTHDSSVPPIPLCSPSRVRAAVSCGPEVRAVMSRWASGTCIATC